MRGIRSSKSFQVEIEEKVFSNSLQTCHQHMPVEYEGTFSSDLCFEISRLIISESFNEFLMKFYVENNKKNMFFEIKYI